ncbi:hypothetical protein [Botrimarina mediterranea]|uniref:hypothetical protein n=1 Tax=Botrimarina mediterranea TaxID=2528022 RepID=UPI001187FEDE|nr:hypothetical protein K2D_05800 [Planctomycetes bacterium K2D]
MISDIDPGRIYFREEIAILWGREDDGKAENLRRWFKSNFLDRGLPIAIVGKRVIVDGRNFIEWIRLNSGPSVAE